MSSDADADHDPHRRESPAGHMLKGDSTEAIAQATKQENAAAGAPGQESPRHHNNRVHFYTTQSHKSIRRLPGSPRLDSREQIYSACDAWGGQQHE
jgi:hypothetical protein